MVGGAPLNQSFADSIGADGYAKDAAEAVSLARKMIAV
jgi:5-methyltetrahydrofolate--homocysteine methyltransferase